MSRIYGYARISRAQQSIDRQIRNIKNMYPQAIILQEAYTGNKIDRPEWNKLFNRVQAGDTIVFDFVIETVQGHARFVCLFVCVCVRVDPLTTTLSSSTSTLCFYVLMFLLIIT